MAAVGVRGGAMIAGGDNHDLRPESDEEEMAVRRCEILLAELAFATPLEFPRVVESNLDMLDEDFYNCERLGLGAWG